MNNGFLLIDCPDLVNDLKAKFGAQKLTVKTGMIAKIDFQNSIINVDNKSYTIDPVGEAAQELIVTGWT